MLTAQEGFSYIISPHDPAQDIVYAPYLRFKGLAFTCAGSSVTSRVVDRNITALKAAPFPYSLGMRPQALRLRILTAGDTHALIQPDRSRDEMLEAMQGQTAKHMARSNAHFIDYIGDTESIIYAPFILQGSTLVDAVTNRPVPAHKTLPEGCVSAKEETRPPASITFIATVCPHCGWDMTGARESCVLLCPQCCSAWSPHGSSFRRVSYDIYSHQDNAGICYIPFWKMQAGISNPDLHTYGDLIRFSCLPKAATGSHQAQPVHFWCPAFKIRPRLFMRLSRQLTALQPGGENDIRQRGRRLLPVTLPPSEAAQAIRVTLCALAAKKREAYPLLARAHISLKARQLTFIPFSIQGSYFVSTSAHLSISRAALDIGKNL